MPYVLAHFAVLPDPHAANARHELSEIMFTAIPAMLAGAKTCVGAIITGEALHCNGRVATIIEGGAGYVLPLPRPSGTAGFVEILMTLNKGRLNFVSRRFASLVLNLKGRMQHYLVSAVM